MGEQIIDMTLRIKKMTLTEYMNEVKEYLDKNNKSIELLKKYNPSLNEEIIEYMRPLVSNKLSGENTKDIIKENKRLFNELIDYLNK